MSSGNCMFSTQTLIKKTKQVKYRMKNAILFLHKFHWTNLFACMVIFNSNGVVFWWHYQKLKVSTYTTMSYISCIKEINDVVRLLITHSRYHFLIYKFIYKWTGFITEISICYEVMTIDKYLIITILCEL